MDSMAQSAGACSAPDRPSLRQAQPVNHPLHLLFLKSILITHNPPESMSFWTLQIPKLHDALPSNASYLMQGVMQRVGCILHIPLLPSFCVSFCEHAKSTGLSSFVLLQLLMNIAICGLPMIVQCGISGISLLNKRPMVQITVRELYTLAQHHRLCHRANSCAEMQCSCCLPCARNKFVCERLPPFTLPSRHSS